MVRNVNAPISDDSREVLATAGRDIAAAIGDDIDAETLSDRADEMATAMATVTSLERDDLDPDLEPAYRDAAERADEAVASLVDADFFEAVDESLPPFDDEFLTDCLVHGAQCVDADRLETAGVDANLTTLVRDALEHTDAIERGVRWEPEKPEKVSPMTTRGSTEGAVYWLDDLGRHLWMSETLLSDQMLDDAERHTRGMCAALLLIVQGAIDAVNDGTDPADAVAEIVGGVSLHTNHHRELPGDLSWITDGMRQPGAWAVD